MVAYADGTTLSFRGGKDSVNMNTKGKTRENSISTHNHPESIIKGDILHTVFSGSDIEVFRDMKEYGKRMNSIENGKRKTVMLIKTAKTTQENVSDFTSHILSKEKSMMETINLSFKDYKDNKISYKQYRDKSNRAIKNYEKEFEKKSKKYNMIYIKEYL